MISKQEGGPDRAGCSSRGKRGIGQREISSPPSPALYGSSVPAESSFSRGPGLRCSPGTGVDLEWAETSPNKDGSFAYQTRLCCLIGGSRGLRFGFFWTPLAKKGFPRARTVKSDGKVQTWTRTKARTDRGELKSN